MGVFAGGAAPNRVDVAGIAEMMRPVVEQWFTAHIEIWDANRYSDPPTPVLVLDSGANGALIQPLRAPYSSEVGTQATTIQAMRFQVKSSVEPEAGQTLRGGLLIKVIDGGNAVGLEDYTFALPETIDSSLSWDRIWEATVVTGGA